MLIVETSHYIGPNRRSRRTVIEQVLRFGRKDLEALTDTDTKRCEKLTDLLRAAGFSDGLDLAIHESTENTLGLFALHYGHICVALQQWAGHEVSEFFWLPDLEDNCCRVIFEYENKDVGNRAAELALQFLQAVIPGLSVEDDSLSANEDPRGALQSFLQFAGPLQLPRDTQAIIDAAARAGIPCMKLDRFPFEPAVGEFRVRPNACLLLGQGCHGRILDGTFAVDAGGTDSSQLKDRRMAVKLLAQLGLPQAANSADMAPDAGPTRIKRTARRIGYPLELSPLMRDAASGKPLLLNDEAALEAALQRYSASGKAVFMQASEGNSYKIVVANRTVAHVVRRGIAPKDFVQVDTALPSGLLALVERAAMAIDVPVFVLSLRAVDIAAPPDESHPVFTDIDLAPELDAFLPEHSRPLQEIANGIVRWLFPPGAPVRIPCVAVTGTNGKTTTTTMVHRIFQAAGYRPGLATTEGVYDEQGARLAEGDLAGAIGAKIVFNNPSINIAALETARGGLTNQGFAFDECDVGVCLNLSADHLNSRGVRTLEQLAALKRTVLERARGAVVLNADDPLCLAMLPFPEAGRCCLVSLEKRIAELRTLPLAGDCFVVVENTTGEEGAVLYDRDQRLSLFAVSEIPAVLGGSASFNLSNALHAAAACYLVGVARATLRQALSAFEMSYENMPGRINFYRALPFDVVIDYMHNPDGVRRVTQMVDTLPVKGRKIVTLTAAAYNPEGVVRGNALAALGHYDFYICCNYYRDHVAGDEHVANQLAQALLQSGVAEDRVLVAAHDAEALDKALEMARVGDLVVAHAGREKREEMWRRLTQN